MRPRTNLCLGAHGGSRQSNIVRILVFSHKLRLCDLIRMRSHKNIQVTITTDCTLINCIMSCIFILTLLLLLLLLLVTVFPIQVELIQSQPSVIPFCVLIIQSN